ncbi:MAG TPA: hypothetical protein VGO01_21445, partial [Bradyrhizobium sp.]|nr:hypothetical protein [Bradyrhizobium sp.]
SGGPSLGRSPARTSSVTPSSKDKSQSFGETGSTQFFERGFGPALFFEQLEKINARISLKTTRP